MLKEDTGTVEAHLTLGNLFRSRGEVDRAIRIHQTLMDSASLTYDQRLLAVQQLGRDYMAASKKPTSRVNRRWIFTCCRAISTGTSC
jgi:lipopolysaccharide biosynthesis regulator YciM